MKIRPFDVGLESYTQVRPGEDAHLPREGGLGPAFIPQPGALDAVMRRPSLDERLPDLLLPRTLDPDLLEPAVLGQARHEARGLFDAAARRATGQRRRILDQAALFLEDDAAFDEEVRTALAALLKG